MIAAIAALRQGQQNNKQVKEIAAKSDEKTDVLIQKTDEIHTVTNAHLSEVTKKWEAAIEQIKGLEATVKTLLDRGGVSITPIAVLPVEPPALAYEDLLKEMTELKTIMAKFATTGMPVIAPAGEPLPVKVEVVSKK